MADVESLLSLAARLLPFAGAIPVEIASLAGQALSKVARGSDPTSELEKLAGLLEIQLPRVAVDSSNVDAVGPYSVLDGTLIIEFKGGRQYLYLDVPVEEYFALISAPSKGEYVNDFIAYSFDYERIA